ncbi:MAG: hypothetical protein M0R02_11885 [Bacteroidales bacterium]|nr:hypothetical protein [Bacteroidales bacterium]
MNTLTVEGWYKPTGTDRPVYMEELRFHITEACHLQLERAEEALEGSETGEKMIPVDMDKLELETPADCGPLENCLLRVYRGGPDHRGHFHLVGHRAADHGLVYTKAIMVDQLG